MKSLRREGTPAMQYSDDRHHLRVEFAAKEYALPPDELTRLEQALGPLGEAVETFPASQLFVKIVRHAPSGFFHVKFKLKLPGQTLLTADHDLYLECAFQRCLTKILRRVEAYKQHPDRRAEDVAQREATLDRAVVAPEDPDAGPLGDAVRAGDYRAFRIALAGYEEWLRNRVGRWVQRFPEAQRRVGNALLLGDLVEEVYLNAFELYPRRPEEVPLHQWLESLLDPSLKALLRHPDEEHENASFARTVRNLPLGTP
jgi:hypothetical protein